MTSLFRLADDLLSARRPFVLCTVVDAARSVPRDGGARMLVMADGTSSGTVGGGPLEAAVLVESRALLSAPTGPSTRLFEATLTTEGEVHLGMKCGGEVRVLLDRVMPPARLVVFGAGHVGLKVVDAARVAGLDLLVFDDRPDRLELVPPGVATRLLDLENVSRSTSGLDSSDFIVIVTRCHDVDEAVLKASLATRASYVGLIGSKRKVALIFRNLRSAGLSDPSRDLRVFAPVGLDIGTKEPGEIAIAVLAEVLAVRDGRTALHRRLPARPGELPVGEDAAAVPRHPLVRFP